MEISIVMNTDACTARLRASRSRTGGTPERFRNGNHEVAPGAGALSCAFAKGGEQGKGGRVSASGEDV